MDDRRDHVRHHGLEDVMRYVLANVGRLDNRALAARFGGLRSLPSGTLGAEYIRFLEANGWPLPGDSGALGDILVTHDMSHVLSGYGTDAMGELETACFTAGFRHREPFIFALFVIFELCFGERMKFLGGLEVGHASVQRALSALERGASMKISPCADWDYWAVIDVAVVELRRRYGIAGEHPQSTLEAA